MSSAAKANLLETLDACRLARGWLERSLSQCPEPPYEKSPPEDWDVLEALASRFGRMTDLLINKLFRAIDRYELEESGSLLDAANRAAKRGLVESVEALRELKDIRNEIVHEYAVADLPALYMQIHLAAPQLLALLERTETYLEEKHSLE